MLSVYEKTLFSRQLWCFLKLKWLKCSLFLMFNVFVLAFLFLVLSVCSLNNEVALFVSVLSASFLFVNKTKWFSGLHLVVLFLFWLFCFHLCLLKTL